MFIVISCSFETGEKIFKTKQDKDRFYDEYKKDPTTGEYIYTGKVKERTTTSTKMYETPDARTLSSGLAMEEVYADYANRLKKLANIARKESLQATPQEYSPAAAEAYRGEVESLNKKLIEHNKNKPRERTAQMIANGELKTIKESNPDLTKGEIKKLKNALLVEARERIGSQKEKFTITENEWKAIQAGAIRPTKLKSIFLAADDEELKKLATPNYKTGMSASKIAMAKAMIRNDNYTIEEVADALGVSVSTLQKNVDIKNV